MQDAVPPLINRRNQVVESPLQERRYCKHVFRIASVGSDTDDPRCELDSHADTCVAGSNTIRVSDNDRLVTVHAYSHEYKPLKDIPVATVATLWVDPKDGQPYILIIHEALYFGDRLKSTLLCPNQLRANGLLVDDVPRQFDTKSSHSIYVPEDKLRVHLTLQGVVSGFESRKPTMEEYTEYPHIELTSPLEWEPHSCDMANKENQVAKVSTTTKNEAQEASKRVMNSTRLINAVRSYEQATDCIKGLGDDLSGDDLYERLIAQVTVAIDDTEGNGLMGHADLDVHPQDENSRTIFALSTEEKRSVLTPEVLSKRWGIGLETAKRTLRVTTQKGIRNIITPGSERRTRLSLDHLGYPNLKGRMYSDTMFANVRSIRGHKAAQVFTNGRGFDFFYPIKTKALAHLALTAFIHEAGTPDIIVTDNAPEEVRGDFEKSCRHHHIKQEQTVPHSPWSNLAEASIRELKIGIRRAMRRTRTPKRLWCHCGQWVAALRRHTGLEIATLDGRTPMENVLGQTPDIVRYATFDWYEPVFYHDTSETFPAPKKKIGRWIGVAETSINKAACYILTGTGNTVVTNSVWRLSQDESAQPDVKIMIADLDQRIREKIGDTVKDDDLDPDITVYRDPPEYLFDDEEDVVDPADPDATQPEADDFTPDSYDEYLTAQILLPQGGEAQKVTVTGRKTDERGKPMGKRHANPLLDTRVYEVMFPDGSTEAIAANLIAENLLSQIDSEGRSYSILKEIVDHRTNGHALTKDEGYTVDARGRQSKRMTTRGWEIQVKWRDGTTSWDALKDLKESNPVELAEYAVANKLVEEPAFAWWVRDVLRRRNRIIKKVKTRYWARTHKFGIELPKTVAKALEIDKSTGTTFWQDAIDKEMRVVETAFEFNDEDKIPVGCTEIKCHMVFDIKMDLTRKARLVAGGHVTEPPKESTYASVVSRDSVRIAFLLAALNDLEVLSADIAGAYLYAPTKENIFTFAGPEFGSREGRPAKIVRALYGLKSSGARWRDHIARTLREAGYVSCKADPDIWLKPKAKLNGDKYYEYVLVYVDDILCISHEPQVVMSLLSEKYTLKTGSVKKPDTYLGADIKEWKIEGSSDPSKTRWAMSSDTYVKRAVTEVERELGEIGEKLQTKVKTPMSQGYRPELDITPELEPNLANYYQGLIGILRWACELGRIDILVDVAMLSRFLANPRLGHLDQCFHIFAYLKEYNKSSLVFDDTEPLFNESRFQRCDWSEYYPGAEEAIPPNAPEPRGKSVTMSCFVDADHAGCRVTRRSHTGVLIFVNRAPILWYSKRQNTVETSTFGSEFIAAKTGVEMVEGLRYKLRMMGVGLNGPTNVFCDNESVVTNVTKPESTLKKKHNAIAYHRVREAQAAGTCRIAKEDGETNLADILTKCLPGPRLRMLSGRILW